MGISAALPAALYEAISGLGITTYTVRPQASDGADTAVYPHIQIGALVMSVWDTMSDDGHDFTVRVHTRWRGGSELPGREIQDSIYGVLHHGPLNIDGYRLIFLERQNSDVTRLPDGSFNGVCEYHGLVETA